MGKIIYKAIAAIAQNRAIGKNGDLPWRLPGDLKWFKKITMGHPVLMGRKTWDSLPGCLPGRKNLVLSRKMNQVDGMEVLNSYEDIDQFVAEGIVFVIGGEQIYTQTLSLCEELYLTEVPRMVLDADAYFPSFDTKFTPVETLEENDDFILRRWSKN
ncbi:MAG: dihydrofolate reductase [Opitutae bacterium]|nr:dihydrofolate reductase [Opitutae bacterium]